MVQAVWSTAQGRPLETTDIARATSSRASAPTSTRSWCCSRPSRGRGALPEALLVAQAVIVATGALPAFWLGRRWLGDDRLAVAAAAVYLLYPPLQWATLTEFHPVTLAAPLLLWCIWAAEERRYATLTVLAVLAALTKEEVGLALAVLGVWMFVRGPRAPLRARPWRRLSLAWVAFAVLVVIPHFNEGRGSEFVDRYATLRRGRGGCPGRWSPALGGVQIGSYDRISYLGALLIPLAVPARCRAPARGRRPARDADQRARRLVPAVLDRVPVRGRDRAVPRGRRRSSGWRALRRAGGPRAWRACSPARRGGRGRLGGRRSLLSGVYLGPLPWWGDDPRASARTQRTEQYRVTHHAARDGPRGGADPGRRPRLGRATCSGPTCRSASACTPSR